MDRESDWGPCPDCGGVEWRVVESHDSATTFLCLACGVCWLHSLGWLARVDPHACPGCAAAYEAIVRSRRRVTWPPMAPLERF